MLEVIKFASYLMRLRLVQYLQTKLPAGSEIHPIYVAYKAVDLNYKSRWYEKPIVRMQRKLLANLPYAGFCEINECAFEAHANYTGGVQSGIAEHMEKEH